MQPLSWILSKHLQTNDMEACRETCCHQVMFSVDWRICSKPWRITDWSCRCLVLRKKLAVKKQIRSKYWSVHHTSIYSRPLVQARHAKNWGSMQADHRWRPSKSKCQSTFRASPVLQKMFISVEQRIRMLDCFGRCSLQIALGCIQEVSTLFELSCSHLNEHVMGNLMVHFYIIM